MSFGKVSKIGEITLSKSGKSIVIRWELGLSGFVRISDLNSLLAKAVDKVPIKGQSFRRGEGA